MRRCASAITQVAGGAPSAARAGCPANAAGMGRHVDSAVGPTVWDRTHRTLLDAPAVLLDGHIEREHDVVNVVVHHAHTVDQPQT